MTLAFNIRSQADDIIHDTYHPLINKGLVDSFIEPGSRTSDFELPDNLKMRAITEKSIVYYCIFRAK